MARARKQRWKAPAPAVLENRAGPMAFRMSAISADEAAHIEGLALVFTLERTVARALMVTQKVVLDSANWLVVPAGASVEVRAHSPLAKVLSLRPTRRLLERAVRDYHGEIDARRLDHALGHARLLPRTVWVQELAYRYFFERTVCVQNDNFVTHFCENELVKEAYFVSLSSEEQSPRPSVAEKAAAPFERALQWLDARLFSRWTVAELAREVGMSPRSLQRAFSVQLGMAPQEYARSRRLDEALLLLKSHGLSVQEVAERVGYSSAAAFSHAFTAHFGTPPKDVLRSSGD